MKIFAYTLLLLAALAIVFGATPFLTAKDGAKEGAREGGALDDDEGEEEKEPEKKPATYALKDYRLEMETKDGRWWKHNRKYNDNEEKANIVLKLQFKLPKSSDIFDININCRAFTHKSNITFQGDTKPIGASNYKALAEKYYESDLASWKEVRNPQKPKPAKLSRAVKKAYRYSFTGQHPQANIPLVKEMWIFKWKDKTYILDIMMTTSSAKNKRIVKEKNDLLKTLRERKKKRR